MSLYALLFALVLAGGLLPALYFAWSFRPRHPFALTNLDAGGWVPVVAALYGWAGLRYAAGMSDPPETWLEALIGLSIGVLIDVVMVVRAVHWRRMRRDARPLPYLGPERRREDTPRA